MGRKFNVNGDCKPTLHYMVNIDKRLREIKHMVDEGDYFTINRARQYGKTTTIKALSQVLEREYIVASLDFQIMSESKFRDENIFSLTFAKIFIRALEGGDVPQSGVFGEAMSAFKQALQMNKEELELYELFEYLSDICKFSPKPVILIIDEVDSAANNQIFLDFLSQLRKYYLDRDKVPTFKSVILAGVHDVKNMQYKIRRSDVHRSNSPWNIAADFLVDMSFSPEDIAGMLEEYEKDYEVGMDIPLASEEIYNYTSGYPFLVSRICKLIDERVAGSAKYPDRKAAWTKAGMAEAVKILLEEKNTLFESLVGKTEGDRELHDLIYALLFNGNTIPYHPLNKTIEIAEMYGFIKNVSGNAVISNRIFETVLYNLFLSEEALSSDMYKVAFLEKNQFIQNGHLNMEIVLERFVVHFTDLYGDLDETFLEEAGRRYFLLYLKPIINGTGNYYIESRTRNMERTDVIIDYNGQQYIIELKIWRGNAYRERGEEQLLNYLDYYHLKKGYMLSFCFNQKKQIGVKKMVFGEKVLVEALV